MNSEPEMPYGCQPRPAAQAEAPSADFIHAISAFLDTDPDDLLLELGYYTREADTDVADRALTPTQE